MKNILQPADHMRNLTSYLNKKNSHHHHQQPLLLHHHQHQRSGNDSRHEDFNSNDDYNHDDDDGNIGNDNIADNNIISDDDKIYVLKQLESLLDDVDNARDYHTIGLWPTLLSFLTSYYSKSIRCHTAWAIGTAVKNTYDYQLWTLERIEVMIDTTIPTTTTSTTTTTTTTTKHSCYNSDGSDDDDDDVAVVNNCSDQGDHVKNELYSSSNNYSVIDIDGSCRSSSSNNIDSISNYSNYIIVSKAVNITCIELLIDLLDPIYLPSSSIRLSSENKDSLKDNVIKNNDNNEDGSDDDDNTTLIETYDMQKRALYAISSSMRGNLDVQNMILSITYYNNNDNQNKMMIKYIEYLYNIGIKYHYYPYDITRKIWSILSDIVEERNYIRYELTHDIYVMMSKNSSDNNSRSSSSSSGDGVDMIAEKNNEKMNNDDDGVLNNINLNIDEINDDLNDIHSMNLLGDHIIHDNRWVILASMIMLEYSQDMINYNNHMIIQKSRIDCSRSDCHNDHNSNNECSGIDCSRRSNVDVDNDGSSNDDDSDDVKTKDYISIHSSLRSIITFIQEHLKSASIHSTIRHQDIDSTTNTTPTTSTTSSTTPSSSAITSISVVSEQVLKAYDIISVLDKDIFEDLLEIFTTTVNIIKNNFNIHT